MSDLDQLKQKFARASELNEFLLDPREISDLLDAIAKYTKNIPFVDHLDKNWKDFWFSGDKPSALNELYQQPNLANKNVPVQQAFLLALLNLLETPKTLLNTLPVRHRLLYYYDLLGFTPRPAKPDSVAVNFILQKNTSPYWLPAGTLLDAGLDTAGNNIHYQTDDGVLITEQHLSQLCWTRHQKSKVIKGKWLLCTAMDLDNNITLPKEGIQFFSSTDHEETFAGITGKTPDLYLGFSGVSAQTNLSVYWSLSTSSQLNLSWSYYNQKNQWVSLDAEIRDDTAGLSVSNLWRARLPDDIQSGGDGLKKDYYWIRGQLAIGRELIEEKMPKVSAVFANAMIATLHMPQKIDNQHFINKLAANTISQFVSPISAISEINQPLPSEGGYPQETEMALLKRAAARINHRQRAITWDNMRSLLMEQYPQIFDIRFPDVGKLNHVPSQDVQSLMVIPDSRYCDNDDELRPILSRGRLNMMVQWLKQYTSLWAEPRLKNPNYIDVKARYKLIFIEGIHPEYGYSQLATQLQQIYMPWGKDHQQAVTPGNKIDYFKLLAELQESPLVQHVSSLVLIHQVIDETGKLSLQEVHSSITAKDDEVLILCPESVSSAGGKDV